MKKILSVVLAAALCCMVFLPVGAAAASYSISGTDITIKVDDSQWYVFTRDNIKNNPELEELGITEEYMEDVFQDNNAYMDAALFMEDGSFVELFVKKKSAGSDLVNLSNYDDDEVQEMAEDLAKEHDIEDYCIYKTKYKFIKLESYDESYGYYLCEFFTVVNKDGYTLTFQSSAPFTDAVYAEIEEIVDSVRFDVDESLKEKPSAFDNIVRNTAIGAAVGGLVGGGMSLLNKKKKKAKEASETTLL
jgi:hypothetical protein